MQKLTEAQKGYLAAMIDGEGCIYITRVNSKKTSSGFEYHWGLDLANTDMRVLSFVQSFAGGRIDEAHRNYTKQNQKNRKNVYRLRWTLEQTRELLPQVHYLLQRKRENSKLLMTYLNIFGERRGSPDTRSAVVDMKEKMCQRMHQLNHVGPHGPSCPCTGDYRNRGECP